ncbi:MAG: molybdopterin molybdotransferase MoeA, partial [Syntrophomonadaceae bacterium]|nr:molybdopterin molybdotransferase MoeA [Syntrophomonadaceae bacterium]
MTEFFQVVSLEEASQILKSNWPSPVAECVDLEHALGRTLVSEVVAAEEVPPFSRSTVDGYAVLASDVYGASEGLPAFLTLTGEIKMGSHPASGINSGECMWIPTGGMLPDGADAVVMVEHTERLDTDLILASRPVSLGENVIRVGEDCRIGDSVLPAGKVMRPQDLGVCAALGVTSLEVAAPLKVGVISTGDEIVSIDSNPGMGQVRDVNSYILAAALK